MQASSLPPHATHVLERLRRARLWLLLVLGAVALGLFPWTAYLSATLPSEHVTHHWQVAWAGFDLFEAAALVATFLAMLRRSVFVMVLAPIAGTALLCDAWFDLVTAQPGRDFHWALVFALFGELPLAVLCFWIAFEVGQVVGAIAAEARVLGADPRPTAPPGLRAEGSERART
ncbi:MAG TPA: hypothetical protein VH297_04385 [Gaiellaceae bacterium]|jgi:hypothetical protein